MTDARRYMGAKNQHANETPTSTAAGGCTSVTQSAAPKNAPQQKMETNSTTSHSSGGLTMSD